MLLAVGLSGGVDSAVCALFLKRCIHSVQDLHALRHLSATPSFDVVQRAVLEGRPWSSVAEATTQNQQQQQHMASTPMDLQPFFIHSWADWDASVGCGRARADNADATAVAHDLHLLEPTRSLRVVNACWTYQHSCFEPMLRAFAAGNTLNVDVLCNAEVKFGVVQDQLLSEGSPGYLATGHYARARPTTIGNEEALLCRPVSAGVDLNDQSVFLARVLPNRLRRVVFPLGHLFTRKTDVRALAEKWGAEHHSSIFRALVHKKTSTGLCFVGNTNKGGAPTSPHGNNTTSVSGCAASSSCAVQQPSCSTSFARFLDEFVAPTRCATPTTTSFIDAEAGKTLDPSGFQLQASLPAHHLTVGQALWFSRPSKVAGRGPHRQRYYVSRKVLGPRVEHADDTAEVLSRVLKEVHLVRDGQHSSLMSSTALLQDMITHVEILRDSTWFEILRRCSLLTVEGHRHQLRCWCCTRHQETPRRATVSWEMKEDGTNTHIAARVDFDEPVRAITPGQALVAYLPWKLLDEEVAAATAEMAATPPPDMFVALSAWIED